MVQFITRHRTPAAEHMQKWRDIGKASFVFSCVGIVGMVIPACSLLQLADCFPNVQRRLHYHALSVGQDTAPTLSPVPSAQCFAAV